MTERLYYEDAYLSAFEAEVVESAEGGRRLYLDRTAFYPTSGGQPHDTGELAGQRVLDVVDEGERVAHVLAAPVAAAVAAQVRGRIDRARRYDLMQQHTGQHLLSAVLAEGWGLSTASVHFGDEVSTLEVAAASLGDDLAPAVERRANELVREGRPVTVTFEAAGTVEGLRKASAREGLLRIVSIEGLDRSACGGTHVRSTAEAGPILLRRAERLRGNVRLEFVCGERALARARRDYETLARVAAEFSAPLDDVPALVAGVREQLRAAQLARKAQEEELATLRARELYERTPPDAAGLRHVVLRRPAGAVNELRSLAQAVAGLPRVLFVAVVEQPAALLLASSEDSGVDAGAELRRVLGPVGGRGGGSARLAQGSVPGPEALEAALVALAL